jgi:rhamnopyranosyl-N-acetylglucosaminyl-diphospho-decaprenol beta-1,3/1,4-galactofuranosyltransferase
METDASVVSADYLASGGLPLYRWEVIDDVGFFDADLFFGYEDLDLGLRLRERGYRLLVVRLDDLHVVQDTAPTRVAWREYYKTRALVTVCRRHLGPSALLVALIRSVGLGAMAGRVRRTSGPPRPEALLTGVQPTQAMTVDD